MLGKLLNFPVPVFFFNVLKQNDNTHGIVCECMKTVSITIKV